MRRPFTMGDGWSTGGQPGVILGVEFIIDLLFKTSLVLDQSLCGVKPAVDALHGILFKEPEAEDAFFNGILL